MAQIAREMLNGAITAFIDGDEAAAWRVAARDEEIDLLYEQIYRELLLIMIQDPQLIQPATWLLWAAHNLERIADRTTNICERVVYMVTGRMEELATSTY